MMTGGCRGVYAPRATVRGALSERGFSQPTAPQRLAIPPLSAGENTLVIAPTGSGKTETAMLPVFDHLVAGDGEPSTPRRSSSEAHADGGPPEGSAYSILPRYGRSTATCASDSSGGATTSTSRSTFATATRPSTSGETGRGPPDVLITTPETVQAMLTGKRLREARSRTSLTS